MQLIMTDLQRAEENARRSLNLDTGRGLLGDLSGNLREATTGRYYVREEIATNQYAPPTPLPLGPNVQIPPILNLAVRIGLDESRKKVIVGTDANSLLQQGINPSITNLADPTMAGLIQQERLAPFFTRPDPDQSTFALYASVYPAKTISNLTYAAWAGGRIDLSGEVPAGGQHLYTIVFWKTDNTLEIASSTTQGTGTALDATDIQQALDNKTAGSLPLWAFVLTGGDTTLSATNSIDLRPLWIGADAPASITIYATRDALLAVTPSAAAMAYAQDTQYFYIFDGTSWYETGVKQGLRSDKDMGVEQDSSTQGYGPDYVTDKALANILIGGSVRVENGGLRVDVTNDPDTIEVYLRDAWQTILYDFTVEFGDLRHTPLTEQIYVWSGNSVTVGLNGLSIIQEYQVSMGAFPYPVQVNGGTF